MSRKQRKNISKTRLIIGNLWDSLFRGMADADSIIKSPVKTEDRGEIIQQMHADSLFDDLLRGEETQRVKEFRDSYYRVIREADKYDMSGLKMVEEPDGGYEFTGLDTVKKKVKTDFMQHPPVYNEDGLKLVTIQDNRRFSKPIVESSLYDINDFYTTLEIERDGITPRFKIEKYITKMVVRQENKERVLVDLYLPTTASQFGKIDAILIANLHQVFTTKNLKTDFLEFTKIRWTSYKGWNAEDGCLFEYDDIKAKEINVFDGSFVITFDCRILNNGTDSFQKYKTKEMDFKYENNAARDAAPDIFTIGRQLNLNLG